MGPFASRRTAPSSALLRLPGDLRAAGWTGVWSSGLPERRQPVYPARSLLEMSHLRFPPGRGCGSPGHMRSRGPCSRSCAGSASARRSGGWRRSCSPSSAATLTDSSPGSPLDRSRRTRMTRTDANAPKSASRVTRATRCRAQCIANVGQVVEQPAVGRCLFDDSSQSGRRHPRTSIGSVGDDVGDGRAVDRQGQLLAGPDRSDDLRGVIAQIPHGDLSCHGE